MKSYHKNYNWRLGFPAKGEIIAPKVLVFFTNFRETDYCNFSQFFHEIPHRCASFRFNEKMQNFAKKLRNFAFFAKFFYRKNS